MFLWLFNVYMDGVVLQVNTRVLRKGLKQLTVNAGGFEINQLLFADTALVADSATSAVYHYTSLVIYSTSC